MPVDLSGLTPETLAAMQRFQAAAAARGISPNVISGYRSPADQAQLYANYQAGRAGRALPYPDRGRVGLAAPPGRSLHERGLAFDAVAPGRQAELWDIARSVGLTPLGRSDPSHFQFAGGAPQAQVQTAALNAPLPPPRPTDLARGTTLNSGPGFLRRLVQAESDFRNIPSQVDPGDINSVSQGYAQIDTPTWRDFGSKVGIDLARYPRAMTADYDTQMKVASAIPFNRYGPRTRRIMHAAFGPFDDSMTVGALADKFGGGAVAPDPWMVTQGYAQPPGGSQTGGAGMVAGGPVGPLASAGEPSRADKINQGLEKAAEGLGGGKEEGGGGETAPLMLAPPQAHRPNLGAMQELAMRQQLPQQIASMLTAPSPGGAADPMAVLAQLQFLPQLYGTSLISGPGDFYG